MSGNLPPGVSASDIDQAYGPSVEPHDHEFVPTEDDYPLIEDMAAIFHEHCTFVEILDSYTDTKRDEVYYEEGQSCEATQSFRFELAYVTKHNDDEPNLRFSRSAIDWLKDNDEDLFHSVMEYERRVARAFNHNDDEIQVLSMDEDRRDGAVVIRLRDIEVGYGPGVMSDE